MFQAPRYTGKQNPCQSWQAYFLRSNTVTRTEAVSSKGSIRWRMCFAWREGHCYDVEIVDDH
jgi:hypothetical protein